MIMAKALNITNWESFARHSICRSAATDYANKGATLPQMKSWGGWKSDKVPMRYVENSHPMKLGAAQKLCHSKVSGTKRKKSEQSDSDSDVVDDDDQCKNKNKNKKQKMNYIFKNCTVNFH